MPAHLKKYWLPYFLGLGFLIVILNNLLTTKSRNTLNSNPISSIIPLLTELKDSETDDLIRYGKKLIDSTSKYFGPHGSIAAITNGINCGNCHRESGTKLYSNNFLLVSATYPKFRERSGRVESVEFRVNECMQRSLNGEAIDSMGKEMKAMVAYIKWTGKNVKDSKVEGAGGKEIDFLTRAADQEKGKMIFVASCVKCHGNDGEGISVNGSYIYPPLWGEHSYAVSAGMYRLTKLASFVKNNMPLGATYQLPQLSDDDAWDVAAFINSQPHPKKTFAYDWRVVSTKPVDYPFGPYADNFSELQHKYGPFAPIKKAKQLAIRTSYTDQPAKQ